MAKNSLAGWLCDNEKSQAWLADQVECSQVMISHIVRGKRAVPSWLEVRICKVTGLPLGSVGRIFIPKGGKKRGKDDASAVR